jgi:dihydrofolate reductase
MELCKQLADPMKTLPTASSMVAGLLHIFTKLVKPAREFMQKQMKPADLVPGRKTFEFFASYWPELRDFWPAINEVTIYVMNNTMDKSYWQNSVFLKSADDIKKLKNSEGSDIQVHGSGNLFQTLLKHDLVDELWLKTIPITLGMGKRLFG